MRRGALAGALALLAIASAPRAADWADNTDGISSGPEYAASKAQCRAVKTARPPASDLPDAAARTALKGCSSEALYYGIGAPADPAKARQCAFLEREKDGPDGGSAFSGEMMLMTIYANGRGAKRDLDLAMHYACQIEGATAEMQGRIQHMAELKAKGPEKQPFDYCSDITSGLAEGYCASHEADLAKAGREARLKALTARWSGPERAALLRLQAAEKGFVDGLDGEVDMSGTARAAMQIAAEEAQETAFLEMLTAIGEGKVPASNAAQAKAADAELNAAYAKVMAMKNTAGWGTVTKADIRKAQRTWIAYRDAWLAFARVKAPSVSADSILAWVTGRRTKMLREFLET